jgi:hypothetical protein
VDRPFPENSAAEWMQGVALAMTCANYIFYSLQKIDRQEWMKQ